MNLPPAPDEISAEPEAMAPSANFAWPWIFAATTIATLLLYGHSLTAGPVAEDFESLGSGFSQVLAEATLASGLPGLRPGTTLFFSLLEPLFGRNVAGYRAVVLLMHAFCGFAVFVLARRCLRSSGAAAFAAAVFLGAPVHPEAVAWLASAAGTVTSASLALAACLVWTRRPETPSRLERWATGLLYLAALLCKETALPLPLLLATLDVALGRWSAPAPAGSPAWRLFPHARRYASVVVALLLYASALAGTGAWRSLIEYSDREGLDLRGHLTIWSAYAHDLLRPLAPDKAWSISPPFRDATAVAWWALAAAATAAALAGRRGIWAVGWTLAALAPGFGKYGERLTYLAVAGSAFVAATLALRLWRLIARWRPGADGVARYVFFASLTAGVLLLDYAALSREIANWIAAGEYATRIPLEAKALLPSPPTGSKLYFRGLIDNFDGAYSLRMGVNAEMRRLYNDPTITSYIVAERRPRGRRILLSQVPCDDPVPSYFFEYDRVADRLVLLEARAFGVDCAMQAPTASTARLRMVEQEPRPTLALFHAPPLVPSLPPAAWATSWRVEAVTAADPSSTEIVRRTAIDAEKIGGFVVVVSARLARPPSLRWQTSGFCPATVETAGDGGRRALDGTWTYVIAPHFEPCWRGKVEEVRLELAGQDLAGGDPRVLVDVSRRDFERYLETLSSEMLRIDLGDEVRNGFLARPTGRRWSLRVPPDAELRFATGAISRSGLELVVVLRAAGDPPRKLFSQPLDAAPAETSRWQEQRVSLSPWAERQVELEFGAEPDVSPAPAPGLAFFADVEVEPSGHPSDEPVSVVLISVDTLRADRLSLYGNPRPTSPRLAAWAARKAVVFDWAIAQAPWTLPSHASMLSGIDSLRHGVNHELPAGDELETLAEILRGHGYRTVAVTGGAWMSPAFGLDQGFDVFAYSPSQDLRDSEMERGIERALKLIEEDSRGPLFFFFHTYHVHAPYRARAPHFERWSALDARLRVADTAAEADLETGRTPNGPPRLLRGGGAGFETLPANLAMLPFDLYDSAVAEADERIADLLGAVRTRLRAKRLLFIVTSDHGESLGEHGLGGHNNLYDEVLRVPLLIEFPDGAGRGARVASQVRSVDLVPTILTATGLSSATPLDGSPLQDVVAAAPRSIDRPARSYTATGPWSLALRASRRAKLMLSLSAWGPQRAGARLFDLAADPGERHDLAGERTDERERLEAAALQEVRTGGRGLLLTAAAPASAPLRFAVDLGGTPRREIKLLGAAPRAPVKTDAEWIEIVLTPGERIELWFERLATRSVRLRAFAPASGELLAEAGFAAADWSTARELTDSGWQPKATPIAASLSRPAVQLRWRATAQPAAQPSIDGDLAAQLRALGYIH